MRRTLLAAALGLCLQQQAHAQRTPDEQRWKAWEQHQQMQQQSPFAAVPWRSIGPIAQGGRVVDIAFHPTEPHTLFVAYASGGLWRSKDNGQSFEPLSDKLPTSISGSIAIDPQNPKTIWYGTGEPNASRSSYSGVGLLKSSDGGTSFEAAGLQGADRISRVLVNPRNSAHVIVAVQGSLYTENGLRGVYQTRDGGKTWTQSLKPDNTTTGASDLVFHPTNPDIVYAATWDHTRKPWDFRGSGVGSAVYRSTDGGKTFARLKAMPGGTPDANIGRIGLAVSADKPDILYVSVDHLGQLSANQQDAGDSPFAPLRLLNMSKQDFLRLSDDDIEGFIRSQDLPYDLNAAKLRKMIDSDELTLAALREKLRDGNSSLFDTQVRALELYRSDDRGDSAQRTHTEALREVTYTYGYYFAGIAVNPKDANHVVMMGVPLIESKDGGKTFSGAMNHPSVHVDHHLFVFDPRHPNRVLTGNDGGVDESHDGGQSWRSLDRNTVGQSYAVSFDLAEPYNVYTGMQDNGTWKGSSRAQPDDLEAWRFINGGDGMQIQVDPRDGSVFSGYQFGNYASSAGYRVRAIAPLNEPSYRYNWQTPILLSPHNPEVLYMGGNKLFRSMDRGKSFEAISGDLTRAKQRGNVPFATLTSISESPKQFGLLWASTDDGQVWTTDDGGAQWRNVSNRLPDGWIARVEASNFARFRAYVAVNRYRDDDQSALVFRTDDSGRQWRAIHDGLPDAPVNVIREDPINENVLYVGTDRGVYVSTDGGSSWNAYGSKLPTVPVHDLAIHPRDRELIAGTHGRSVWIADVLPLQELSAEVKAKAVHGFYLEDIDFSRGWRSAPARWFDERDQLPTVAMHYYVKQTGSVQLDILNKDNAVLQTRVLDSKAGLNYFEWDMQVDLARALAAEASALKAKQDKGDFKDGVIPFAETPYQSVQTYGWRPLLQPGDYRARFTMGDSQHEVSFKVKAPEPFKPRYTAPKIRGRL